MTIFAIDFRGLSVKLRFLKIAEKGKSDRKMGKIFQIKLCKKIFDFLIENSVELQFYKNFQENENLRGTGENVISESYSYFL